MHGNYYLVSGKKNNKLSPFGWLISLFMAHKITKISVTNKKISERGGITLFLRYVEKTKLYEVMTFVFYRLYIFNTKGLQLQLFIKQVIFFYWWYRYVECRFWQKKKRRILCSSIRKQPRRNGFIASDNAIFQKAIYRSAFCVP